MLFAGSDPQRALTLALARDLHGYGARVALVDHAPAPNGIVGIRCTPASIRSCSPSLRSCRCRCSARC
ncbi:MAG: hypothetical protein HND48_23640 [Chloroflexi bacterium]|nr:hypothetical protein [Chloroflexota bacterium]